MENILLRTQEIVRLTKRPLDVTDLVLKHMMAGATLKQASLLAGTSEPGGKKRMLTLRKKYKARNNMHLVVILMRKGLVE